MDYFASRMAELDLNVNCPTIQHIHRLRKEVTALLDQHQTLKMLVDLDCILGPLSLDDTDEFGEKTPKLRTEEMEQVILAKSGAINEAYSNLVELAQFDFNAVVAQFELRDYKQDVSEVAQRRQHLYRLASNYYQLLVKNMLLLERHTLFIIKVNQFWLTTGKRLASIEAK